MFQLLDKKFILVRVSGGWISWNYNQLSQAKAETQFCNKSVSTTWVYPETVYKLLEGELLCLPLSVGWLVCLSVCGKNLKIKFCN